MKKRTPTLSLSLSIALFCWLVVAIALGIADIIINERLTEEAQQNATQKSMKIARFAATAPLVIEALSGKRNEADIQVFTDEILRVSDVNFITVINQDRLRESHPNPEKIGDYYEENDADPAFAGEEVTSIRKGSLGVSIRAFSPVFAADGHEIGVVLVGILVENVQENIAKSRTGLYAGVGAGMLVGAFGALLLARKIKKIMFGLEPVAIAHLFEERNAILHSVREGVLAVDKDSCVTIVNEEARHLFARAAIYQDPIGQKVDEQIPNTRLQKVLESGEAELDQEQDLNGIAIWANRVPIIVDGEVVGAVATFRDKTEIRTLAEKLTGVSLYADALRAQTHEFMNKLHVIQGMIRLQCFDRLNNYINQIAGNYQLEVGSVIRKIKDPVLAGFLLGKISVAKESGIAVALSESSLLPESAEAECVHDLITILGNLIDNSFDALQDRPLPQISLHFALNNEILTIEVKDSGAGIPPAEHDRIFTAGYSSKGARRGFGLFLVKQCIDRLNGTIAVSSIVEEGTAIKVTIPYNCKE